VLDIACATGYSTAVLAQLAGAVIAVEADEELAQAASEALAALELGNASIIVGTPAQGYAKEAPYDVIFVNGAMEFIPDALIGQLAEGGRLVGVLREDRVGRGIVGRKVAGAFGYHAFMDAHIPVLPGFSRPPAFRF
ncbi:MAG: methyltransferase domain-containing protein, partial [Alphaproteobacteria bacterium]